MKSLQSVAFAESSPGEPRSPHYDVLSYVFNHLEIFSDHLLNKPRFYCIFNKHNFLSYTISPRSFSVTILFLSYFLACCFFKIIVTIWVVLTHLKLTLFFYWSCSVANLMKLSSSRYKQWETCFVIGMCEYLSVSIMVSHAGFILPVCQQSKPFHTFALP